jgi:hypothetical protein
MRAQIRRRLEMAERVRDFLRVNETDGVGQGLGLARLEELLERAKVLVDQQSVGVVMSRRATQQRREVKRALQRKILRYLRVVGQVAAKQNGALANEFPLPPSNATHAALLSAARTTLEKATAQKDVLVTLGMSQKVLDDLAQALGDFERTLEASRAGRREHSGASAELEAIAAAIGEQVKLLDGVVQYQFGDDAELMGAWASARNVVGPFKPRGQQQDPGSGGSQSPKAA